MATSKNSSTAVAVKKPASGALVSMKEAMAAQLASLSERTAPATGNAIRITQGKEFILPSGEKTDQLQVVVVDFTSRNEFYEGMFDKDNISPPACFAIGSSPNKLTPSVNSPVKQADTCAECPMNAFGSAQNGKGKACKNTRVLAVLPPGADADTPIWTLKVSPTGIKGFDGWVQSVARTFQTMPVGVVATVGFSPSSDYASLVFSDAVPNEMVAEHFARQEEARQILAAEPDVSGYEAPKPIKGPVSRRPAVARR